MLREPPGNVETRCLLRQFHIELATHGIKLRLWGHIWILVKAGMVDYLSRQLFGVFDHTRNQCVDLLGHLVQKTKNLFESRLEFITPC